MQVRSSFTGTGGELFKKLFVGMLLVGITFGIYMPWFIVGMQRFIMERTTIHGTRRGDVKLTFTGSGGQLFVKGLVGYLLTMLTIGIYGFWFICDMARFYSENSVGTSSDGTQYRLKFNGTGGSLFGALFVNALLVGITFGIYMPWFICKLQKWFTDHSELCEGSQPIGRFEFTGAGGELFGKYLVGMILTMLTVGIYAAWFQVDMMKFFTGNTRIHVGDSVYVGQFTGTGGQFFGIMFVGYLLTMLTLGIYSFWWMANQLRFQTENTVFNEQAAAGRPAMAGAYPQPA